LNVETELKFALPSGTGRKLLKSKAVKQAARGKAHKRRLVSTYYDTRQHGLRKNGAAFRVRQAGDEFEQTVKVPASGPLGMQNLEEWNVQLPDSEPDLRRFDGHVLKHFPGRGKRLRLRRVFTTDVERTTMILARGKTHFEMAVDVGQLCGHSSRPRRQAVNEVEFEITAGNAPDMLDFILRLAEEVDLQPLFMTKAQRGYALARPALRPRRTKAKAVRLDPESTVGEAFQDIVGEALRHLHSNQQPALEGQPGGIHQSRVAIRRIRAALRAFKKVLPYDKRKAFNGELRWFQGRLAPARDWHVFANETLPLISGEAPGATTDLERLHQLAVRERRRATTEAQELITSKRYTRLLLQFQRWLLGLDKSNREMFERPLKDFAADVLDRTRRDLLLDRRPLSRMSEEDRHGLRKRGKKARYAMEFFSGLWQGPAVERYLKLMEQMQDCLGTANDAVVARMLMASLPPRALESSSLLLVQDWSQARELQCNRTGQPVWRQLQGATPFWN